MALTSRWLLPHGNSQVLASKDKFNVKEPDANSHATNNPSNSNVTGHDNNGLPASSSSDYNTQNMGKSRTVASIGDPRLILNSIL